MIDEDDMPIVPVVGAPFGYASIWFDSGSRSWRVAKVRHTIEAADIDLRRHSAAGRFCFIAKVDRTLRPGDFYAHESTPGIEYKRRWTWRDIMNQIVVWCSWVRS